MASCISVFQLFGEVTCFWSSGSNFEACCGSCGRSLPVCAGVGVLVATCACLSGFATAVSKGICDLCQYPRWRCSRLLCRMIRPPLFPQAFLNDHVELRQSASFGDVSAMVEQWMSLEENNDEEHLEENGMGGAFSF